MKKITILGSGLVGSLIVRDLARDPELEVTVVDRSDTSLGSIEDIPNVRTRRADLANSSVIAEVVTDADVVVGAVPGRLGHLMLRSVIERGKPIADISFSPEDPMTLDDLARERGVPAIVDCGVSPGLSNLAVGRAAAQLDWIEDAVIYVGGLPVVRRWPYEYRIVFSATDVIEEYTRPARLIESGRLVTKPALTDIELVEFSETGTLEAFNTDGLRTLLRTVEGENMREKTLRYPGHADRMRMLRESGFFSEDPVSVGDIMIEPRRLTEQLLFDAWKRPLAEEELTVLRVNVTGRSGERKRRFEFELFDRTDTVTGDTSMARTTGFPCAIIARALARGQMSEPGIKPLELIARDTDAYSLIISGLRERGVALREHSEWL